MSVIARKIEIEIVGDSRSLERAFGRAGKAGSGLGRSLSTLGRTAKVAIGVGVGAGVVGLGLALHSSIKEFQQAEQAAAQTNAVIKSTGGAANVTAKHVTDLAGALLKKTGIDDEVIQSGENMLLTFRGIRNEVGKGNDIFDQAVVAGLDMSKAMEGAGFEGGSLKTTMIRLGKALNDPVRGMTALRRVGVSFTKAQEDTIKKLVETGHTMKAQKLILAELTKEFGGSAAAAGKTLSGQLTILKERFKNFGASIVAHAVPPLVEFFGWLGKIASAPDLEVKLKIAGKGISDFAARVKTALGHALFSWEEVIPQPTGLQAGGAGQQFATVFHAGLLSEFANFDWGPVGQKIGQGISASIRITDESISRFIGLLNAHAQDFAELGLVIALNLVKAIFDIGFWLRHWQLVLSVLGIVIFRGMGKIAVSAAGKFLSSFFGRIAGLAAGILFQFERLPGPVLAIARFVGRVFTGGLAGSFAWLKGLLGQIPGWFKAAFKVGAVLAVVGAIQSVIGKVQDLYNWLKRLVSSAWNIVVHLDMPSIPGRGLVGGLKSRVQGAVGGNALGGRVTGGTPGKDSVLSMLMPDEIVYNPRFPTRGLAALAEEGIVPMRSGGRPRRRKMHKGGSRPAERAAEKRERAKTEVPISIEQRIADARLKGDNVALLAALKTKAAWLRRHISLTRDPRNKLALTNELIGVNDEIESLATQPGGTAAVDNSADLQAQLDQERARNASLTTADRLREAFISTGVFGGGGGGGGGNHYTIQSLVPPDDTWIRRLAGYTTQGLGMQGHVPATSAKLGI